MTFLLPAQNVSELLVMSILFPVDITPTVIFVVTHIRFLRGHDLTKAHPIRQAVVQTRATRLYLPPIGVNATKDISQKS